MEDQFAHQFLEMTKSRNMPTSAQSQGLPQPPLELPIPEGLQPIDLPSPQQIKMPSNGLAPGDGKKGNAACVWGRKH